MLGNVFEILRGLLPSRELPTPIWLIRLVTVFGLSMFASGAIFFVVKDTELGSQWGLGRKKVMSAREFQYISRWVYTNMASIEFNHPEVDSAFLLANYDRDGDFVAGENTGTLGIFSAYAPDANGVINLFSLEDIGNLRSRELVEAVLNQRRCFAEPLRDESQQAISRALPGFLADNVIMCPIINTKGRAYASIIVFWKEPSTNNQEEIAVLQSRILSTTSRYSAIIQEYLNGQPTLFLE